MITIRFLMYHYGKFVGPRQYPSYKLGSSFVGLENSELTKIFTTHIAAIMLVFYEIE